jgi:hypothetical protein
MASELQIKLQDLQRQEVELQTALQAINESFEALGIPISKIVQERDVPPQSLLQELRRSGLRMGNKLSFRGQDKAAEHFKLVDRDKDGLIGYEDLRGMSAFCHPLSLVTDSRYQSR